MTIKNTRNFDQSVSVVIEYKVLCRFIDLFLANYYCVKFYTHIRVSEKIISIIFINILIFK